MNSNTNTWLHRVQPACLSLSEQLDTSQSSRNMKTKDDPNPTAPSLLEIAYPFQSQYMDRLTLVFLAAFVYSLRRLLERYNLRSMALNQMPTKSLKKRGL